MIRREDLISADYLAQQRTLHMLPQGYGGKGSRWAVAVRWVAARFECGSVLDYGCGQGSLARELAASSALAVREYDPAIAGKDGRPAFADLVVCTDVLEHIEPERLGHVLEHLRQLARRAVFLVVSLRPANKVLPDGRNAHLIVRSPAWWQAKCEEYELEVQEAPDLPLPPKFNPEKAWIALARPRR